MSKTEFATPSPTEITVKRTFDAPRDNVWAAFTQCEYLVQWWAPEGWSLTECEMDLRPGGSWRYCMFGPISDTETMESRGLATFREIIEPEQLVYKDVFADADYNPVEGMPIASITVTFTEADGKTTVLNHTTYPTQEDRDKIVEMGVEVG
ncbi:MAG: SRPBCC domain-containing protein, partial [Chloroflexota bacterium]